MRQKVPFSKDLALASTPVRSPSKVGAAVGSLASTPVRSQSKVGAAFATKNAVAKNKQASILANPKKVEADRKANRMNLNHEIAPNVFRKCCA